MTSAATTPVRAWEHPLLWSVVLLGILLRAWGMEFPDLTTDEAQYLLGATNAHPPLGIAVFRLAQDLLGSQIGSGRAASSVAGMLTLLLVYHLARVLGGRGSALTATAVATIFTPHVLLSRFAMLDVLQVFAWLSLLIAFLCVRERATPDRLVLLYVTSVLSTLVKAQGFVLPLAFLCGSSVEWWGRRRASPASAATLAVIAVSLVPIGAYLLTHPAIPATVVQLSRAGQYGVGGGVDRLLDLLGLWWSLFPVALVATLLGLSWSRGLPWPFWIWGLIAVLMPLLLGPGHEYYATYLLLPFAVITERFLRACVAPLRTIAILLLVAGTLTVLPPHSSLVSPLSRRDHFAPGYWNTHADVVNAALSGEEVVTVLGYAGHQLRWYLTPRLLVGRAGEEPRTPVTLTIKGVETLQRGGGAVLYEDERILVRREPR